MKKILFSILFVLTTLFIVVGFSIGNNDNVKNELISIKKDKAKKLHVDLNLGAGEMTVSKGAKNWIDGSIDYNRKLEPTVSYSLKDTTGEVKIDQSKKHFPNFKIGKFKNEWDLKLTNKVPLDLDVNTGASKTNLDLRGLKLKKLNIETGVGELNVNLSGNWKNSFDVNIESGVGKTTIILPSNVGVKVKTSKGIGKANVVDLISKGNGVYVNKAYEDSKVKVTINMELGVGEVNLKVD
ncbi:toast rack family protein [Gottfriedia luciferensis]|uniref:toast rack family protein n=1 Tax=Gottfriedia luciferensis TaxID=178774 RepID=UPI000B430525|nr:toast rack family protein [Gottfriedia luciferensis]